MKPKDRETTTLITRRRWDWYFLGAAFLTLLLGFAAVALTGDGVFLRGLPLALLGLLLFWLGTRVLTPRSGLPLPTIRSSPGVPQLLAWLGSWLVLSMGLTGLMARFGWAEWYWAAFAVAFLILLVGIRLLERRYAAPRPKRG